MFLIIKYFSKLIKALSSDASPKQIAAGFILGMIIGLTPLFSIHNLIIIVLILGLKVNVGFVILAFTFFSGVAHLADPIFHNFGIWLLEKENYQSFWVHMYNNEWWAITRFYNTVVIGSFISSIILSVAMFPSVVLFVKQYRLHIHAKFQNWKIVKALKGTKIYSIYVMVSKIKG
jgi:uncharacterized protein (TIGR03546 family)